VPLNWGRKYLMCPPEHFGVMYEINPWMHREVAVDADRTKQQWTNVRDVLTAAGAEVTTTDSVDGLPDMVFAANAGLVWGSLFVPSGFRHAERRGEEAHFRRWARAAGLIVADLPGHPFFEGAGDALPFRDRILAGYRTRSEFDAHTALAKVLDVEVLSVELVDQRFYHLDLTFCPLDDRHALIAPKAWDAYGRTVVESLVPSPIELTDDEANAFCANSVVVGDVIVMPSCTPRLERELSDLGLTVVVCAVDEFLKAGGGVRCMTLALDVRPDRIAER
jgi:N-dimethylarginine dimethylaminohydrolase